MNIQLPSAAECFAVIPYQHGVTRIQRWDLSENNQALRPAIFNDLPAFTAFINQQLQETQADYGVGGYNELRSIYARSQVFGAANTAEEPRRLHIGLDIWGPAQTPVYAVYDGVLHSNAFHPDLGNYGAVIILQHSYRGNTFYTLYGHLSQQSLHSLQPGDVIKGGDAIGALGAPAENGGWPPHLHFQCMLSMGNWMGDYPGVCKWSEREYYLANCPNPEILLPWG